MSGFDNEVLYADNVDFSGGPQVEGKMVAAGQLLIGAGSAPFIRVNTLTAGVGIGITNADGQITISLAGGTLVQSITGGPGITVTGTAAVPIINNVIFTETAATTLAVDSGYFTTAAGTYSMPATAAQGEMVIVCAGDTGVALQCPASNFIRIAQDLSSSGGTATSTLQGDSVTLRYRLSTLTWEAVSVVGTWLLA